MAPPEIATPEPGKFMICRPLMVLPSEVMWKPSPLERYWPSSTTPALLASMVRLPWLISGSALSRVMVIGLVGGKTIKSKVMVSPGMALSRAWRSEPTPESVRLVTTCVFVGVVVGVGDGLVVAVPVGVGVEVSVWVGVLVLVGVGI